MLAVRASVAGIEIMEEPSWTRCGRVIGPMHG